MLLELAASLRPHLPRDTALIRYDLPWSREGGEPPPLRAGRGLRRAVAAVQPPSTVVVDLRPSENDILTGMKSKWRYNIGLARRKGVEVIDDDGGRLAEWYDLHRETGVRDRIVLHSFAYYRALFDLARTYGAGAPEYRLLLAQVEGEAVAGIVVCFRGARAWYPYGASSDRHRGLMPNYLLQWQGIRMARERGCLSYDFCGIPPSDDPSHPMHGLYRFKTGFGGTIVHRPGCWDVALAPVRAAVYRRAEALRDLYYKRLRKRR